MQDIDTLSSLFDNKVLVILAVLVNHIFGWLYLMVISKYSGVSDSTNYSIIKKLLKELEELKNQEIRGQLLYLQKSG